MTVPNLILLTLEKIDPTMRLQLRHRLLDFGFLELVNRVVPPRRVVADLSHSTGRAKSIAAKTNDAAVHYGANLFGIEHAIPIAHRARAFYVDIADRVE